MNKLIQRTTITTRLVFSFAIIILVFFINILVSIYFNTVIDGLNRHNVEFVAARREIVLMYHQEFSEMRRLIRESFMNPAWLEDSHEITWREAEQRLSASHARLAQLASAYIESVRTDTVLPERPDDSRIHIMTEIMAYADTVYGIYRTNFFLGGNMSLDHSNVLDYTGAAETMLQLLNRFALANRDMIIEYIEDYRNLSNTVTIITFVLAIALATFMAITMVRSFISRIKSIEADATLVAQGNFETALQNKSTDEISRIFNNVVTVIVELISEIDGLAKEKALGNARVRINTERFEGGYQQAALVVNSLMDAVMAAEERHKLMIEGNPVACYLIDKDFKVLDCNNVATTLLGFANKRETLARSDEIFTMESLESFRKNYYDALEKGYKKCELDIPRIDGTIVPCDITFVRFVLDGGDIIGAYLQDATAVKQMLEQHEQMLIAQKNSNIKSRFLANMSHEIRTPLAAVIGIAELQLHKKDITFENEEAFSNIHNSASTLLSIVNDILDLSKIEADKLELYN